MGLKTFYLKLPRVPQPKDEFLKTVSERTGVSITSVRNWVLYGVKPSNQEYIDVLVELTGLKEEELWKEE